MPSTHRTLTLVAWLLVAGCGEPAQPSSGSSASVCPKCSPQAGGESSDFGGVPTPCGSITGPLEIDEDEAVALGYDMEEIHTRLERGVDAPLRWQGQDTDGARSAEGYERSTRVHAQMSISSITHVRPDPEYCDGTRCVREEVDVEQASCPDFLSMALDVELSTDDGAVNVQAHGQLAQWSDDPRFFAMIGEDTADHSIGHAYANLHDVTGELRLFPPGDPFGADAGASASQPGHPFPGTFTIVLELMDDETHGTMWPSICWEAIDERGDSMLECYEPLKSTWPSQ